MQIKYIMTTLQVRHDSHIWNSSALRGMLQRKFDGGERNTWLLGDARYHLEPFLMTPYRSAVENSMESRFNAMHSRARNIVERVNVCAALHNISASYRTDPPINQIEFESGSDFEINDNAFI